MKKTLVLITLVFIAGCSQSPTEEPTTLIEEPVSLEVPAQVSEDVINEDEEIESSDSEPEDNSNSQTEEPEPEVRMVETQPTTNNQQTSTPPEEKEEENTNKEENAVPIEMPEPIIEDEKEQSDVIRTIKVIAKRFEFVPSEIRVKVGEKIKFNVINEDTTHNFFIEGTDYTSGNIYEATTAGTYVIRCATYCGSGHGSMTGTLIVE
jgi:plastocyanin